MQKIVASLPELTKTPSIKKAVTFMFASFFMSFVSCFYTAGVGADGSSLSAVIQLTKQNPDLPVVAFLWGITESLWLIGIFCLGLAMIEFYREKSTKPRRDNLWLKPNAYLKWMLEMLHGSAMILLMVVFTARGLGLDSSQIELFAVNPHLPSALIFFLSLGKAALMSSGLFALLGVMTNLSAVKKPVTKA